MYEQSPVNTACLYDRFGVVGVLGYPDATCTFFVQFKAM